MMIEKDAFNIAFGKRVRAARKAAKLKGEEAAEAAGITAQFLSEVERGKKGIGSYNLAALAKSLRVTTDYLIYGRTDADEAWLLAAEHLASLPPAQRDMAAEVLECTLSMVKGNVPS